MEKNDDEAANGKVPTMKRLQFKLRCDTKKKEKKKNRNVSIIFIKDYAISCYTCMRFCFPSALNCSFNGIFQEESFRSNLKDERIRSVNMESEDIP